MWPNKLTKPGGLFLLLLAVVILAACSQSPDPSQVRAQTGTQIALTQIAYGFSPPDWTPTPQPTATPFPTPTPTATPLGGQYGQWMKYDESVNKLMPLPQGVQPEQCFDKFWGCPGDVYYFYQNGVVMNKAGTPWWWPWIIFLVSTAIILGTAWFFLHKKLTKYLDREFKDPDQQFDPSTQPYTRGGQRSLPYGNQPQLPDGQSSDLPAFLEHVAQHDEVFASQLMVHLEQWEEEDQKKDRRRRLFNSPKEGDQ